MSYEVVGDGPEPECSGCQRDPERCRCECADCTKPATWLSWEQEHWEGEALALCDDCIDARVDAEATFGAEQQSAGSRP